MDRFNCHAEMLVVMGAEFTTEGIPNILVNRYNSLWKCLSSLLSESVSLLLGIHKLPTSAYHHNRNGGRLNYTMMKMPTYNSQ